MLPTSRQSRAVRGLLAASFATLGAFLSHLSAGGPMPGWLGFAVPWVLSVLVCTGLAGRRLSLARLALGVGASQLMFHALFVLGTAPPGPTTPAPHLHTASAMASAAAGAAGTMPDALMPSDSSMWLWHGVAAVATIAVFHRGERTLARLRELAVQVVEWARHRLDTGAPVVLPLRPAGPSIVARREPRLLPRPQRCSVQRRGPPAPSGA